MTGRSKSHCRVMQVNPNCTQSFEVAILTELEAWIFFQKKVGKNLEVEGEEIVQLAKSVAGKCSGLPLALEIVGSSMIDATLETWRVAEINLKRSPQTQEGMEDKVLGVLKCSFDWLKDDKIKNCLLYCCLWGKDEAIPKDDLIDYWFGEGFLDCDYSESLYEAQNRGHENIRKLVSCCLLLEVSKDNRYVKMHDLVRDMCLWLTSGNFDKYGKCYAYLKGDHHYSSSTMTLNDIQRLSAKTNWASIEKTLPGDFIASENLHTFLCYHNYYPSFQITKEFFQNCTSLRVLELKTCVLKFPLKDLSLFEQLRYLGLSCTELTNLPYEIGLLPNLVLLDLSWNENLKILPDSIGKLKELQKLDLSYTGLKKLPYQIGFLTKLEILRLSKATGMERFTDDAVWSNIKLQTLASHKANIHTTSDSIHDLYNLRHLVVSNALGSLENLENLNSSCFEFECLPYPNGALKMFRNLIVSKLSIRMALEELDLSKRKISILPITIYALTMLRELDLSQTKISMLSH